MGVRSISFLTDFQMEEILRGLQILLPCWLLSLWSLQGAVSANEFGQYHLGASVALTKEEGVRTVHEFAGLDRVESPEWYWDGDTELGPEYDENVDI